MATDTQNTQNTSIICRNPCIYESSEHVKKRRRVWNREPGSETYLRWFHETYAHLKTTIHSKPGTLRYIHDGYGHRTTNKLQHPNIYKTYEHSNTRTRYNSGKEEIYDGYGHRPIQPIQKMQKSNINQTLRNDDKLRSWGGKRFTMAMATKAQNTSRGCRNANRLWTV